MARECIQLAFALTDHQLDSLMHICTTRFIYVIVRKTWQYIDFTKCDSDNEVTYLQRVIL